MNSSILIIGIGLMMVAATTVSVIINQQQDFLDNNYVVVDNILEQFDTQVQNLNITKGVYDQNEYNND